MADEVRGLRRAATVLIATEHGPLMVNRLDYNSIDGGKSLFGVGHELLEHSVFAAIEVTHLIGLLEARRKSYGSPVVALDGGANIGVHSVSFGRAMTGWGSVLSFEPQERLFYMLAGNIALNNLLNVRCRWSALGERAGQIAVPVLDYEKPANFGGLQLQPLPDVKADWLGQSAQGAGLVDCIRVDDLNLSRLDLLKLDVEGMEPEVLRGAADTIKRCQPIIFAEQFLCGAAALRSAIPADYTVNDLGAYALAVHAKDKVREHLFFKAEGVATA